jgi:phasin family protein
MTILTIEQIVAANQTAVAEAQALAATAFSGFEKLVELNLAATKSALFDNSADLYSVLNAKNANDALAAQAALVKPLAEKTLAYGRSVYAIASETGAELSKAAEAKVAEGQKTLASSLESLAKNAPAGSEAVVAVVKSAVTAGQNAIDSAKTSAKKAVELVEKQVATVSDNALNAVKTATSRKK